MKTTYRKTLLIGILIAGTIMLMVAWYYALQTLVNIWWIVVIALSAAAALMPMCRKLWARGGFCHKMLWQWLIQLYVVGSLIMSSILCTNYIFAGDYATVDATIQRKYREQHRRMRRVSRRVYTASGEVYYDYYVTADFGNGVTKSFYVPLKKYKSMRVGDICEAQVAKGLFGLRVVRRLEGGGFLRVVMR